MIQISATTILSDIPPLHQNLSTVFLRRWYPHLTARREVLQNHSYNFMNKWLRSLDCKIECNFLLNTVTKINIHKFEALFWENRIFELKFISLGINRWIYFNAVRKSTLSQSKRISNLWKTKFRVLSPLKNHKCITIGVEQMITTCQLNAIENRLLIDQNKYKS